MNTESAKENSVNRSKFPNFLSISATIFVAILILLSPAFQAKSASAPSTISYQGKLLVNGSSASTTQQMYFILYDSLTGGTALYSASGTVGVPSYVGITPIQGLFTINFGESGTNALDANIFKNYSDVYLEVRIGAETLTPRKKMTATPYAFNSKYLEGVAPNTNTSTTYIPVSDASGNFNFNNVTSTGATVSGFLSVFGNSYFGNVASGTWNGSLISTLRGGTGADSSGWTGFAYLNGGTWMATTTIASTSLASNVMIEGENVSLLNNDAGYVTSTSGNFIQNQNSVDQAANFRIGGIGTMSTTTIGTTTSEFKLTIGGDGGIIARGVGTPVLDPQGQVLATTGTGTRMIWYPRKGAFRAGTTYDMGSGADQWDDANIGGWSFASGLNTMASGLGSIAMGANNTASGEGSFAVGSGNIASSDYTISMGYGNTASSYYATALGGDNIANARGATAIGNYNTSSGQYATALGTRNIASGLYSSAFGGYNIASQQGATVFGQENIASGIGATAFGNHNVAGDTYSTVFGWSNTSSGWVSTAFGRNLTVSGAYSFGVNASSTAAVLSQNNVIAFLGGNVGINTTTPSYPLSISGDMNLSGALRINGNAGTAGHILQSNGTSAPAWVSTSSLGFASSSGSNNYIQNQTSADQVAGFRIGGIGTMSTTTIGTTTSEFKLTIGGDGGIIAHGTFGSGATLSSSGAGTRMIWYPRKAAFRAGIAMGNEWDDANVGSYSVAMVGGSTASATGTVAIGAYANASAQFSAVIGGVYNTASGLYSFVGGGMYNTSSHDYGFIGGGFRNVTTNDASFIGGGRYNTSSARYAAVVGGSYNQVQNTNAFIGGGENNTNSGISGFIGGGESNYNDGISSFIGGGMYNTSTGYYSFVGGGIYNEVSGNYTTAFGQYLTVSGEGSFGVNVSSTAQIISQPNTIALLGGNVGVGTTTPSFPLTVSGDMNLSGALRINGNAGTAGHILQSNGTSAPAWVSTSSLGFASSSGSNNYIQNQTSADQVAGFRISGNGIFNGGSIGVGTTTPAGKIQVVTGAGALITVGTPSNVQVSAVYASKQYYTANSYSHNLRVYAFKDTTAGRVYSSSYDNLSSNWTDNGSSNLYRLEWTWDAVDGATGYRVLKYDTSNPFSYNVYKDVATNAYTDNNGDNWLTSPIMTPTSLYESGKAMRMGYDTNNYVDLNINSDDSFGIFNSTGTGILFMDDDGEIGIDSTNPLAQLYVGGTGAIVAAGTFDDGNALQVEGAGTRMMWYPEKSAFRAGTVTGDDWDDANIGEYSAAFGADNFVFGTYSFVAGEGNTESGWGDTVFGVLNNVYSTGALVSGTGNDVAASTSYGADYSAVFGSNNNVSSTAFASVVGGAGNNLAGRATVIFGENNTVNGNYSSAFGYENNVPGTNGVAFGEGNIVSSTRGAAFGYNNEVYSGTDAFAAGWANKASGFYSFVAGGGYNTVNVSAGFAGGGWGNIVSGQYGAVFGNGVTASGEASAAFGYGTYASGTYSVAFGNLTVAGGSNSAAFGQNLTVNGNNSFGVNVSSTSKTISQNNTIALLGGNVGINTTTPSYPLSISGDMNLSGALRTNGNAGTLGYVLQSNGASAPNWVSTSSLGILATDTGGLTVGSVVFASSSGKLTQDNSNFFWDDTNNRLGIGTSTPSVRLAIDVSASVSSINGISLFAGATQTAFIGNLNNSGNYIGFIALGTSASDPNSPPTRIMSSGKSAFLNGIHVGTSSASGATETDFGVYENDASNGAPMVYLRQDNASGHAEILYYNRPASQSFATGIDADDNYAFKIDSGGFGGTDYLAVAVSGNVGIGTTTPNEKLVVDGSISVTADNYYKYNGVNLAYASTSLNNYYFGNAGNLTMTGASNTASGYQALYSNSTGYGNIANGSLALYNNTTGYANVASGYQALYSNTTGAGNIANGYMAMGSTTANNTSNYNVANGYYALHDNTTGDFNIASGWHSLRYNTTGDRNVAIGRAPLRNNTTGSYNVASGDSALYDNITGNYNVGIGSYSLYSNTTSDANVGIGYQALYNNIVASNTAVGYQALYSNTTGVGNIAMGYLSLYANQTGGYNSAYGINALYANTTGNYNTALGAGAISLNQTGSFNTAVGVGALATATSSDDNTAVGYGALYVNSSGSNNTAMGRGAMLDNTLGSYNTGIGRGALKGNQIGNGNVALGYYSLYDATSSNANIALGYNSLRYNTASSNTAVGYEALYSNTTGVMNTAQGYQAMYSNTTGYRNSAFGYQAMGSTTAIGTGMYDSAMGYQALFNNTSGMYNSAIGYQALYNNTTGAYNTALAYDALYNNTTGGNNTAIGLTALYQNITGSYNTALGVNALRISTTSLANTAIGYGSLYNNTVSSNTAVGYEALYDNTAGFGNVAQGYQALHDNTTGDYNVGVGNDAVRYNTTGNNNVGVGYIALGSSVTGSNNVGIGVYTLRYFDGDSNNTAIGYNAGAQGSGGSYNTMLGSESDISGTVTGGTAVGYAALVSHNYATAIGNGASSQAANSITLGSASYGYVYAPGLYDNYNGEYMCWGSANGQLFHSTTVCSGSSDIRLKINREPISGEISVLDAIKKLDGIYFNWDLSNPFNEGKTTRRQVGLIAQQVMDILPELVSTSSEGYYAVEYPKFVAFLVEVAKAQQAQIEQINLGINVNNSTQIITLGSEESSYHIKVTNDLDFAASTSSALSGHKLSFSTTTILESSALGTNAFILNALNYNTSSDNNYILSLRSNNSPVFSVSANGDVKSTGNIYASSMVLGTSTNPGDLAEKVDINPDETVEAGDVMMVDPSYPDRYQKSNNTYEQTIAGVVSTNPTIIVGNGKTSQTAPLAMVGRVPVKFSNENGNIQRGDLLVASGVPGKAMRYDPVNDNSQKVVGIIGIALDNSSDSLDGKIMTLIRTGWVYNKTEAVMNLHDQIESMSLDNDETSSGVNNELDVSSSDGLISYNSNGINFHNNNLLKVATINTSNSSWRIDSNGLLIAKVATSEGDKDIYGMTSENAEITLSGSANLVNGEAKIMFATGTQELIDENEKINVTVTPSENCNGVYVTERSASGFKVVEFNNGTSSAQFDWQVIAKRKIQINTNDTNTDTNDTSETDTTTTDEITSTTIETTSTTDDTITTMTTIPVDTISDTTITTTPEVETTTSTEEGSAT